MVAMVAMVAAGNTIVLLPETIRPARIAARYSMANRLAAIRLARIP
jgi:hypothetical protein